MSQDGRPDLIYEKFPDKHYAIFTMNRPERLNAGGGDIPRLMDEAVADFSADSNMYVGIITGVGRAFSAGMDLRQRAETNAAIDEVNARLKRGEITSNVRDREVAAINSRTSFIRKAPPGTLSDNPKPFIAAVNGLAMGGGTERAMDCDIRIASTESYFALSEVRRGLIPGGGGCHFAPRLMPMGHAALMLLAGGNMSAEEAYRIGFVQEVVEPDRLIPRCVEIAEQIAGNAPLAVQACKKMLQLWRQFGMAQSQQLQNEIQVRMNASEDSKEGPLAFAEKRTPVWKGR
ncbi:MAG: enoyl-CoA hydratase/isomerase family protein [Chloroflexi bacterium]|nr:enoyl-CoA hydratase/isomerase family protein [Chloroflexota bacterium]